MKILKINMMTLSEIKASLLIVFLLVVSSCYSDTREEVVSGVFIYNRVNAHYYVNIEKHNGNGCVHDSIDKWLDHVVNDHLQWVYYADSTTCLRYNSKDFATQYREYAYQSAIQYDKDLSTCGNDVGKGEVSQSDSLKIYKTHETINTVSYTAEEYFSWGNTHPTRYKINVVFEKETGKRLNNELLEIS